MNLETLATAVPCARLVGSGDIAVDRIVFDSRGVRPGDLFVALPGTVDDGARYIRSAFDRGAVAVVAEKPPEVPADRSALIVPSARQALGLLSACLADWPSRHLRLVGVTGTDGKTTTTTLIASILRCATRRVGVVSTVRAEVADEVYDTGLHTTTPDALGLQYFLRRMVEVGAQDAVLEVTSHGLAQERVTGCDFDVAVITNVTSDHLDLHGTYENYLAAKLKLFENVARSGRKPGIPKGAAYNLDDSSAGPIAELPVERKLSYALERRADVNARAVRRFPRSSAFDVEAPAGSFPVELPLAGWYNVANALAAIAASLLLDVSIEAIQQGLANVPPIPGRLEPIDRGQPFEVFVDFAHTPNSLAQVLGLARERCRRQVAVVFGCAGLRDRQKRSIMGEIASRFADRVYLTAEDPRTENVDEIIENIAVGCRKQGREDGKDFWRIPNRGEAIDRAIREAKEGDLVLVTGKGHEQSMCIGLTERPWSDHAVVRAALDRCFPSR